MERAQGFDVNLSGRESASSCRPGSLTIVEPRRYGESRTLGRDHQRRLGVGVGSSARLDTRRLSARSPQAIRQLQGHPNEPNPGI